MADNGDGWLAVSTKWRLASIKGCLLCAWAPQSMNTTGCRASETRRMIASVSVSQPLPAWLAGWPSSTVRQVLSNNTPFCAHGTRLPPVCEKGDGGAAPPSRWSSLKMLRNEGGMRTPGATENASPSACPRPW